MDLEMGYEDQRSAGHDISLKCQLKRFGGLGYDHILRGFVPTLHHGLDQVVIDNRWLRIPVGFTR
ncbi:MAG: hypothetical protein U0V56_05375 [Actinomycetota bacterium]